MSQRGLSIDSFAPDDIGSEDVLFENLPFVGTVQFIDGILVFLPAFAFLFTGNVILPDFLESYTMYIAIVIALLGSTTLIMKPAHLSLYDWLNTIKDYRMREKDVKKHINNSEGKPFDSYEAIPDDDTRKLTKVSKVYPTRKAIELDDGSMISIIEFNGSNLDMAPADLKTNVVDQYARAVSSQLEYDIQFYLPMRPISIEATASRYEDNLEHLNTVGSTGNEMQDAFMRRYLEDRSNWVRGLATSSYIREQYVIVKVDQSDVYNQSVSSGQSGIAKLPAGELIKDIYIGLSGNNDIQSENEVKRRKVRELSNRRSEVGGILAVGPGNDYNVVETQKAVSLIKEFWEGEKILSDEMDAISNEYPFSVSKIDGDQE